MKTAAACLAFAAGLVAVPLFAQQSADDNIQLGNAALARTDWKSALADFTTAIQQNPTSAPAYAGRAFADVGRGDQAAALNDINHAILLSQNDTWLYVGRAQINQLGNHLADALQACNDALKMDASNSEALRLRAVVKKRQGDLAGSKADFAAALALDPTDLKTQIDSGMKPGATPPSNTAPVAASAPGSGTNGTPIDPNNFQSEFEIVSSKIEPTAFNLNHSAIITIRIVQQSQTAQPAKVTIALPKVDGLSIRPDATNWNNGSTDGVYKTTTQQTFSVRPLAPGNYTIPSFDVTDKDGKTWHAPSDIVFKVTP
jgi:tetratricopeptide (TPR) repeat protein